MKYPGGKFRQGKRIINSIRKYMGQEFYKYNTFVDLFTGGGNMLMYIPSNFKIYAVDIDCEVIEALKQIYKDPSVFPKNNKEFTKEDYDKIKLTHNPKWLAGIAKYSYSFGTHLWEGYAGVNGKRDTIKEQYNNITKQHNAIKDKDITFICDDYRNLTFKNSIIYADPPYNKTILKAYEFERKIGFDWNEFYNWIVKISKLNNVIFFTDYSNELPKGFIVIEKWERKVTFKGKKHHKIEYLITYKGE